MKEQSILIQYLFETALILVLSYIASLFFPWWIIAVVAAVVSFVANTKALSFVTGFVAIAILWGRLAYGLSAANEHILASKMALLFSPEGTLGAMSLVILTALIGGLVGGLGAWTGKLGRQFF